MIGTTFSEAEMATQTGPEARDTPKASMATTSGWMFPTWTRLRSQGVMIIASANAAAVRSWAAPEHGYATRRPAPRPMPTRPRSGRGR